MLHAGIYYETGSLKHQLCIAGHTEWLELSGKYNIPIELCGKYIIASNQDEVPTLSHYFEQAKRNGVLQLRRMNDGDFAEISPFAHVVDGFYSPRTGIIDVSSAVNIFYNKIIEMGVLTFLNREVLILKRENNQIYVKTTEEEFSTQHLFNCGGADAIHLRQSLGLVDCENRFVKGNYLKLNKLFYNKKLIYPVPLKELKGLGIHTSFHLDKIIRFGPNTEDVDSVDYKNSPKNIDLMYPAIAEKFKGISREDLSLDYVGVRTKLIREGKPYNDFLIQGPEQTNIPGYYEALGIESPGVTAAPAIAEKLVNYVSAE